MTRDLLQGSLRIIATFDRRGSGTMSNFGGSSIIDIAVGHIDTVTADTIVGLARLTQTTLHIVWLIRALVRHKVGVMIVARSRVHTASAIRRVRLAGFVVAALDICSVVGTIIRGNDAVIVAVSSINTHTAQIITTIAIGHSAGVIQKGIGGSDHIVEEVVEVIARTQRRGQVVVANDGARRGSDVIHITEIRHQRNQRVVLRRARR
mmetsp:Transcript_14254/g.21534  ORF Transcript_14254/g.21534 Transcript_14254/m.21534 type:complete len:207 (+) Transcript_14254:109-729(+)